VRFANVADDAYYTCVSTNDEETSDAVSRTRGSGEGGESHRGTGSSRSHYRSSRHKPPNKKGINITKAGTAPVGQKKNIVKFDPTERRNVAAVAVAVAVKIVTSRH